MKLFFKNGSHCRFFLALLLCGLCACSGKDIFEGSGDVGDCALSGSYTYDESTDTYTLKGAGENVWGKADQFFMVWKKVTGDFSLSSAIAFEGEGVQVHRKMGIMMRESLDGDAAYADVTVHGDGLTSLQYRPEKGADTKEVFSGKSLSTVKAVPDHITLERRGDKMIMKTGIGEFSDETDGEMTVALPETCYVGLFICSHDAGVIETGYFSGVTLKK